MINFKSSLKAACLLALGLSLYSGGAMAQDIKDVNPHSPTAKPSARQQKKADKKKLEQKKLGEKAIEIGKKRHEKLQTKEVRKRMRQSKRKASLNNAHQQEFFLKRWFRKKPGRKSR
jgi:hypothetical protein